ncbi:hypothetical protein [Carnobacterium jeotgali]|uniref:hypothetical protein n=1 Tax=Carnobacterium jeotgali TaxID=545534 RepID=UPI0004933FB2|nr:hypothetical protein [Carnobacterium jeotgali]
MNHDLGMMVELKYRNLVGAHGRSEFFKLDADFLNDPVEVFNVGMAILYILQYKEPSKALEISQFLDGKSGDMNSTEVNDPNARQLIESFVEELEQLF